MALLLAGTGILRAGDMASDISLRISGVAGTAFAAECRLRTADGEEEFTIATTVPYAAQLSGTGLHCRIDVGAAVEIEIRKDGNVTRTRTSGGTVQVGIGS